MFGKKEKEEPPQVGALSLPLPPTQEEILKAASAVVQQHRSLLEIVGLDGQTYDEKCARRLRNENVRVAILKSLHAQALEMVKLTETIPEE